jgi:uncharacterized protein (DUF1778 family)
MAKNKGKKIKKLTIRIEENKYEWIKEEAEKAKQSINTFFITAAFQQKVLPELFAEAEVEARRKIAFELKKIGINLNQYLIRLHKDERSFNEAEIREMIKEIDKKVKEIVR